MLRVGLKIITFQLWTQALGGVNQITLPSRLSSFCCMFIICFNELFENVATIAYSSSEGVWGVITVLLIFKS